MALAGYPQHYFNDVDNRKVPASPNLGHIINETNRSVINNFIDHLFNIRDESFKEGKKLRPLLNCMFATLLMYHNDMKEKFGDSHIITSSVIRSAAEFGVTNKLLIEWGTIIKNDWVIRNTKVKSNSEEMTVLMESLISMNDHVKKTNSLLLSKVDKVIAESSDIKKLLVQFEGMYADIRQYHQGSPSKKRRREVRKHACTNFQLTYSTLLQ